MKTKIIYYWFNTSEPDDKEAYAKLVLAAGAQKGAGNAMVAWDAGKHGYKAGLHEFDVELETKHIFGNQWTGIVEGKSLRVFDWAESARGEGIFNVKIRTGHYLVMTDDMREIRRNTMVCGYCGAQEPAAKGYVFCPHCLDSEYLTEKDLPLTRMVCAADSFDKNRKPLSKAESGHLLPLFRSAQTHGNTERGKVRIAAKRARVEVDYAKAIKNATVERDGMVWLMDKGINTDNVIYYGHTGKFGFGWRKKFSLTAWDDMQEAMGEPFPFPYKVEYEGSK
jgi:hypothetical protein